MKKIEEIKLSLMEKDENFSIDKEDKGNYIIRSSANFFPQTYLYTLEQNTLSDEDYKEFIEESLNIIYKDLINKNNNKNINHVGIWVKFVNDSISENAIDLTILNSMNQYNDEVIPIKEFFKMTIPDEIS